MDRQSFADYQGLTRAAFSDPGLTKAERGRLLREAAALATPNGCRGEACESDASACKSRYATLSPTSRRDCLQRLWAESNACKLEAQAAIEAGTMEGFTAALNKWVGAEKSAAAAAAVDPAPSRVRHWRYLAYWRCLTAAQIFLHGADFPSARKAFTECLQHARHVGAPPHPFYGSKELAAEDIHIDAVASVKAGQFSVAAEFFEKWLSLFPERRGVFDLRFDSVLASHLACVIIDGALNAKDTSEPLARLRRHLHSTNVFLPIWTLWRVTIYLTDHKSLAKMCSWTRRTLWSKRLFTSRTPLAATPS